MKMNLDALSVPVLLIFENESISSREEPWRLETAGMSQEMSKTTVTESSEDRFSS